MGNVDMTLSLGVVPLLAGSGYEVQKGDSAKSEEVSKFVYPSLLRSVSFPILI